MTTENLTLHRDLYLQVANERKTLSMILEEKDPSPEGSGTDAFQRQLKRLGIKTKTLSHQGIWADPVEAFYRTNESQVLFPEYIARQVRAAVTEDTVLPYLIGQQTMIDGDTYKTYYVEDQPAKQRKKRATEASELPKAVLKGKDQTVRIYKFGRQIEASYEAIRRMQIDMLALHVRRIAMQNAKDKVEEILSVIQSGDGNDNAAPVLNLTAIDTGATAGTLTAKGFLGFLMEFEEFPCNTIIGSKEAFLQVLLTNFNSLSAADVLRLLAQGSTRGVQLSLATPQFANTQFNLFWNTGLTGKKILGINNRFAIEEVTEAGSDIMEADKFITRQVNVLTVSENSGYSKMFPEATKVLDIDQ